MSNITSQKTNQSLGSKIPVRQFIRRFGRLSGQKKMAVLAGVLLFVVSIAAAYFRAPVVLIAALILLFLGGTAAALKVDALLKGARTAARRSALALQAVPAPAPAPAKASFGTDSVWATDARLTPAKLVQRLTKLRSLDGRDILVRMVTNGQWNWKDLETALEMYRQGGPAKKKATKVLDSTVKIRLLLIADLCYRQNLRADDMLNAVTIYRFVYQKLGAAPFKGKKRGEFYLDALSQTGRGDQTLKFQGLYDAEKLNPTDLHLFRANAKNPFRHQSHTGEEWLAEINAVYESAGLATIALRTGSGPAFARLAATAVDAVETGPLVTVVMPVYRPDEYTDLAIQSALDQSYRNLEIIIVDDGSGDPYTQRLDKWETADSRIQVIRNTPNSGAYTSRNIGYSLATGQFLTIFDGDDWQHPQKIEMLVAAAVERTDNRLVSAPWARADQDLMFHYRGWRGAYVTPAHVSAMFPVDVIREKLGFWDTVRKAADTEFILRYRMLVSREEPLEVTNVPLTLSLVGASNLSMDDFRLGYRSPDRVAYRSAYEHWHEKVEQGEHSGFMTFEPGVRCFPAPAKFLPVRGGTLDLGVLVVGDFAAPEPMAARLWNAVRDARAENQRVGVMHVPSIINTLSIDASFPKTTMEEFDAGTLHRVEITDAVSSAVVHIFDPTAFEYTRELRSGQSAESVVVHASASPYNRAKREQRYSVGVVSRNVEKIFGAPVRWTAAEQEVYEAIGKNLARASDLELVPYAEPEFEDEAFRPDHQTAVTA
ncbi:glycosyltransferase family A protein [Pseudarthrobacter sp. MEB009]|uniref:glycosyltransferase family 2 protein n=1 Tax=Pseudarthrobacter sp. MEB009 TaxID=3040326 RepID=UPI0009E978E0|nr:glycosyltransferase family A protein [Pseudarthrobacter sp. MEB009]